MPLTLLFLLIGFESISIGDLLVFGGTAVTSNSLFEMVGVFACEKNVLLLLAELMLFIFYASEAMLLCLSEYSDSILYASLSSSYCFSLFFPIKSFELFAFLSNDIRGSESISSISLTLTT